MKRGQTLMKVRQVAMVAAILLAISLSVTAQTPETPQTPTAQPEYKPKFPGDPARSQSEALALGYMRTVLRAQREYKKKNDHYATSLLELVHTGSFTRRMASPDRGDYTVGFKSKKDGFELTLTPKELSADHRSFYAEDHGEIHADEEKAADENSPKIK
jgi:hypothetical protein